VKDGSRTRGGRQLRAGTPCAISELELGVGCVLISGFGLA
jgi:hypothetical protein